MVVKRRGKRWQEECTSEMWEGLPSELLKAVLATLEGSPDLTRPDDYGRIGKAEGKGVLGWRRSEARAAHGAVRLVCKRWRDCHDSELERLTVGVRIEDEGMQTLARRLKSEV